MNEISTEVKRMGLLDFYLALLVAAIILIKRLLISRYGINPESPREIQNILNVLNGGLIYKDFFWYHGFFPVYWHALIFKTFSPEIYYVRLFVTIFATVASFFAYWIARNFLSPGMSVCVSLLGFTGLIVTEHGSGEMMAFCCITVSFYYLLQYCNYSQNRSIYFAGLIGGVTSLVQVLPLGMMAFVGGMFAIACYSFFGDKKSWGNIKIFLIGYIPIPLMSYGFLAYIVTPGKLIKSVVPFFTSGESAELAPSSLISISVPSLLPVISFGQSLQNLISNLNKYLFVNLRWWMIVLVFAWGLTEFLLSWKRKKLSKSKLLSMGTLILYGPLFETKSLLIAGPNGLTSTYINMLPTYILLFYLIRQRFSLKRFPSALAMGFLLIYFLYPFAKYYNYFSKNAVPLNMPYSKFIAVSPYKYDLYHKTVDYIKSNTEEDDSIVFSGVNHFFSIFSGRNEVFKNDVTTFVRTSMHPANKIVGLSNIASDAEKKVINAIERFGAKLILLPDSSHLYSDTNNSPYLSYLDRQWKKVIRIGDDSLLNPFDHEPAIFIYERK
tara:strand:- start:1468 stop:3126 length:1659 start_codon:yes stop_codon:yes gene_type:complete